METLTESLHYLCSQGRCFVIDQSPLPVCQRCLGLYTGFALTVVWLGLSGVWRRGLASSGVLAFHVAVLLLAMAGGLHWLDPGPRWRLACGLWTGHVAALWIIGGMMEGKAGRLFRPAKGNRHLLCEAAHRTHADREPFQQEVPVTFSSPWPRWATLQAVLAVPLLFILAMAFPWLTPLGWWFWTVVALTGIAAAFCTVAAALVATVGCPSGAGYRSGSMRDSFGAP